MITPADTFLAGAAVGGGAAFAGFGPADDPYSRMDEGMGAAFAGGTGLTMAAGFGYLTYKSPKIGLGAGAAALAGGMLFADQASGNLLLPAALGAGAGAVVSRWAAPRTAKSLFRSAKNYFTRMPGEYSRLEAAALKAGKTPVQAGLYASRAYLRPLGLAGAGAALGYLMSPEDPAGGAQVGAGAGLLIGAAARVGPGILKAAKFPGAKLAGVALATGLAAAAGLLTRPAEVRDVVQLSDDGAGGVEYAPEPYSPGDFARFQNATGFGWNPVRRRLDRMSATGDMVFGLNNRRHGY